MEKARNQPPSSSSRSRGKKKKQGESLRDSVRENLVETLKQKNMQFRYKAVEDVVAPLIHQVKWPIFFS